MSMEGMRLSMTIESKESPSYCTSRARVHIDGIEYEASYNRRKRSNLSPIASNAKATCSGRVDGWNVSVPIQVQTGVYKTLQAEMV